MKKLSYKDYSKQITAGDNGNVQSHDKEESKSNSTIITNSGVHTLTHDQIINILNCCKVQIVFKNKTRLGNNFHFKDRIPNDLTSGIVYKFQSGLCNESYYGDT